jgi:hypothetical protein
VDVAKTEASVAAHRVVFLSDMDRNYTTHLGAKH